MATSTAEKCRNLNDTVFRASTCAQQLWGDALSWHNVPPSTFFPSAFNAFLPQNRCFYRYQRAVGTCRDVHPKKLNTKIYWSAKGEGWNKISELGREQLPHSERLLLPPLPRISDPHDPQNLGRSPTLSPLWCWPCTSSPTCRCTPAQHPNNHRDVWG